jgi:HK97 family phage prohead protease
MGASEVEARSMLAGERRWAGELRTAKVAPVEERAKDGDEPAVAADPAELRLSGYSAVFDSDSEVLHGFFVEQVKRGAFKRVLADPDLDVRLLINHEGSPFARTTNGTLKLEEKPRGLFRDALLDDRRSDARDLSYGVERGDFTQSSFAFTVARDAWETCEHAEERDYAGCDCIWSRSILEVGSLIDDTVATYPAYPASSVLVARESGQPVERDVQASDEELRDEATGGVTHRHVCLQRWVDHARNVNHVKREHPRNGWHQVKRRKARP